MKRLSAFLFLLALPFLTAAPASGSSKDEKNLEKEIMRLSRIAQAPKGEASVMTRITTDFKVASGLVGSLRDGGLSYGDIAVTLSFARMLNGGISDRNIERVLALRRGPPALSWGAAADRLGLKIGKAVTQLKKINNEAHRLMKQKAAPPDASLPGKQEQLRREPAKKFTGEGKSLHPED